VSTPATSPSDPTPSRAVDLWTDARMTTIRIAAYDAPSAAEPASTVVVLPGLGASVDALRDAVPRFDPFAALAATGVGVLAVDWPGHGRSGGERGHLTYRAAMDTVAAAVDVARDRARGDVVLVGLGFGGTLACYAALEDDRVAAVVSQGLCDLRDIRPLLGRWSQRAVLPIAALLHRHLPFRATRRIRVPLRLLTAASDRAFDPDLARRLERHPQWVGSSDLAALASLLLTPEDKPALSAMRTPTLVVVGARDHVLPAAAAHAAASQLAGPHRVWVLPAAGHQLLLEHPGAVLDEVTAFLTETLAEPPATSA
jgi:pimeloyl-ACP methyl ester carboxylesterase